MSSRRRWVSRALMLVAAVGLTVSAPAVYAATVLDEQDAFVAVTDQVLAHPEVRDRVAEVTATVLIEAVSNDEAIVEALPEAIRPLTVPAVRLASTQLARAAFELVDTELAVRARHAALRQLHQQLTEGDGEVTIDLRALLVRTSRELAGPAAGSGVASLLVDQDIGRYTLIEAGSPAADAVEGVLALAVGGVLLMLASVLALVAAVIVSPDRRAALVTAGLVTAGSAIVAAAVVSVAIVVGASAATDDSPLALAVAEVLVDDIVDQQQSWVVVGGALALIGLALGQRPAAVALRSLPADLWRRRPGTGQRLATLVADNPPAARLTAWLVGAGTLLAWNEPTARVLVTVVAVILAVQLLIWVATASAPLAASLRSRWGLELAAPADDGRRRLRVNLAVIVVLGVILWPGWSRGTIVAAVELLALTQAAVDLGPARSRARTAAPAPEPGLPSRRRLVIAVAGLGVVLIGALLAGRAGVEQAQAATACNGRVDLCERRLDELVFAGSHNAMSSIELGWKLAMQTGDMIDQLDHGVRALLIDALYWTDEGALDSGEAAAAAASTIEDALSDDRARPGTWLCHGFCALGATDLTGGLTEINAWLTENPREVLLIIVQDEISRDDLTTAFEISGLRDRAYAHPSGAPWPTLGELIETDQRVLVFGENQGSPDSWFQNAYEATFAETPYTFATRAQFSCEPNRGRESNPLFLINHWITTGIPVREAAVVINSREVLLERVRQCQAERGRLPTVLATDFVETGDLIAVVDELNATPG